MLAHHPITGEPIKIMRTSPSVHADNKTMVWLRETFQAGVAWSRWFSVVSEVSALKCTNPEKLCAVILTRESVVDEWIPILPTIFTATSDCLLCAPAVVVKRLDAAGVLPTVNVFITEDLYESYPFLGSALLDTDDVPTVLCGVAHVLRMNRIAWSDVPLKGRVQTLYEAWKNDLSGSLITLAADANDSVVPRTWLIQQYFNSSSTRRTREILNCLEKNLANPLVDHVVLLNEKEYPELPTNSKLIVENQGHRLTYYDVYVWAQAHVPDNDIVMFSNSDIYFDGSLVNLWRLQLSERRMFLALLRWEADSGKIFGPRADSQDTWIFSRNSMDWNITRDELDFPFGKPGCDNVITYVMMKHRYLVLNPAFTIITHHLHSSSIRNYDAKDILYRPIFVYVEPTAISSLILDRSNSQYIDKSLSSELAKITHTSFPRVIEYVNKEHYNTCLSMLRYAGIQGYSADSDNLYTPSSLSEIYHFTGGVFTTFQGLAYTFQRMFMGNKRWEELWAHSNVESLTPSMYVPKLLALPVDLKAAKSLSHWIVNYLPRVLLYKAILSKKGHTCEFLIPQVDFIGDFLNDCVWKETKLTVVPIMEEQNYYSGEAWVLSPQENDLVSSEDIRRLRKILPATNTSTENTVTICIVEGEEHVCSREWAESLRSYVFNNGWTIHVVSNESSPVSIRKAFQLSSWIVGAGDALRYMWMANKAHVMEFQKVDKPSDEFIHLAGACGHTYILGGLNHGESLPFAQQAAMLAVNNALQKYGFQQVLSVSRSVNKSVKPVIVVPNGDGCNGIYSHTGNQFREMVELWSERGYVDIVRSSETKYCWWEGIGKILLYDYPTSRWWLPEIPYQMAMFGCCAPAGPEIQKNKQSVWCYWVNSPRLIERTAEGCRNLMGWDSRPIQSLFLGKVENGVQQTNRCGADWKSSVELWSMPIDPTGGPYPFTQEQYIEKLCLARFGLCLPGIGPKCNREIEYFACGVVPIVTPGVDMKGYLVPPVEGVHYLRAATPEEVRKVMSEVSAEKWAAMSSAGRAWWRTYCSAEGLFRLTWARIEQCRPYFAVGIPQYFAV